MKSIKFNNREKQPYNINLIENIEVKSFFDNNWLSSEHWGWNNEGENSLPFFDFGRFGEIMFEIGKSYIRLFFPDTINFTYTDENPSRLYAIPYEKQTVVGCIQISPYRLSTELEFKKPIKTMFDLKMHLQGFINQVNIDIENLQNKHAIWISEKQNYNHTKDNRLAIDDDLPF